MREQSQGSSKRLAIFDLDGTLVELPIDYQSLKDKLAETIKMPFQNIFPTVRTLDEQKKRQAFEIIDAYERLAVPKMRIREGSVSLIRDLKARGRGVSIVTMQGPVAGKIVSMMGVEGLVDFIVTREDSLDRKRQVSMVLEKYGALPADGTVIGDKEADYAAAAELGCRGFLVRRINDIPYRDLVDLAGEI